jgi:hypothetical protein
MKAPQTFAALALVGLLGAAGVAGCDNQGPVEQFGEEVDEAVDTVRDGEESVATKVDDAVDELRE